MLGPSWKVGEIEIHTIIEMIDNGLFSTFIPNATPSAVLKYDWLRPSFVGEQGNLIAQVQSFLIRSNGKNILIDTCNGNHKDRPSMPTWSNLNTNYLESFSELGITQNNIDYVACTHLHFDHVGWNTVSKNGEWIPTFPNAIYLFSEEEYEYWEKRPEKEVIDDHNGINDSVRPIVSAGLAKFVPDDYSIDNNLTFFPTPGHTPHHISVLIQSKQAKAVITGDVMHHPCQIAEVEWTTLADTYPETTVETRKAFLETYANTTTLIIGSHFANPISGYIVKRDNLYTFEQNPTIDY